MDFKKIENIFLVALVLLNIYLLVSYINRSNIQSASTASNKNNLIRDMQDLGIDLPNNFPESQSEVYYMQADSNALLEDNIGELENQAGSIGPDGALYTSILSDPIKLTGDPNETWPVQEDLETLNEFVSSSSVLFGDQYQFLRYDRSESRFIYSQVVDGIRVADGTSEISLYYGSGGDVISYQQTYAGPMVPKESAEETISGQRAVEILFQNNEIASNAVVSQPILTYQRTLALEDLSIYGPVWLVPVTENNQEEIFRVDAFDENGTILPTPTIVTGESSQPDPDPEPEEETENADE